MLGVDLSPLLAGDERNRGGDLTAGSPFEHDHRQPCFLLELRVGEMIVTPDGVGIDLPEHALSGVLGQLLECFESQRRDTSRH